MEQILRARHTIDATGNSVGRVASHAAKLLQGKHKATYVPNRDEGDFVVVENASFLKFTGDKFEQKNIFTTLAIQAV